MDIINTQNRNARLPRSFVSLDGMARPVRQPANVRPRVRSTPAPVRPQPLAEKQPVAAAVSPLRQQLVNSGHERSGIVYPAYNPPVRPKQVVRRRTSWRKRAIRTSGVVALLAVFTGGFLFYQGYSKLHKVFHGTGTVAALSSDNVNPELLKGEGSGRVNILLAGIGGDGHEGPDLTDTLLIMSVDPVNHTAVMLSVPRDLWVKQPVNYFGANQKINAVYESAKYHYIGHQDASSANTQAVQAGFNAEDTVLKQVLGININYHALVDFKAFRQAIDTVGGVSINVTEQLYDPTMAWENHNNPVLAAVGLQNMNGTQALIYARSRETTSDFARTQRQRQIILALKDAVLSAGTLSSPAKIDGLLNAFGDNVYTDLSTQAAQRLLGLVKQVGDNKITSIDLATPPNSLVTTDHVGNLSVVRPLAGFDNYAAIQAYVRSQLKDGYIVRENAPVTILAPTLPVATALGTDLKTYGYNVTATLADPSASTAAAKPVLVDLSGGKAMYTRHYLESRFGVSALSQLPVGVTVPPGSAKFVIISGK